MKADTSSKCIFIKGRDSKIPRSTISTTQSIADIRYGYEK